MTKMNLACWMALAVMTTGCGGGGGGGSDAPPDTPPEDPGTPVEEPPTSEPPIDEPPATDPPPVDEPPAEDPGDNPPPGGGVSQPTPSIGCGGPVPETGNRSIAVTGGTRQYILDLPTGYDADKAYPLVFSFHGRGRTASDFRTSSNLRETMGDAVILVHPQGVPDPGAPVEPERDSWERTGDRDIAFFDDLYDQLTSEACVDQSRVFTTGMSMGGFFAARLACERGDVVRAFASAAAGPPLKSATECVGRAAAWTAHDPQDELIDYTSDGLALRDYWLDANVCGEETRQLSNGCVEYTNCDAGYPVRWCQYSQADKPYSSHHEWPSFAPREAADFFLALD
ncbi:PHB depolymerase family esterase [Pseudomonas sp. OIL-1]|uniref:alpha/beta hydrolase family esterase n=1 Tax=Pseudomonas sp. OIL-1 TaxID=2706126 RepID=UPI0013A78C16|nr:alpha/beta hydrolase-fold protein [Pseudomonas sp. OIL-1]QIB52002.1 hypothetical protein G3M63_13650 [Pseudomonas sp. OIL-1]